jgi:hypothetical protein
MNQQIILNGQSFDVIEGFVRVSRDFLTSLRLEEIPNGVTIMHEHQQAWPEVFGVKKLVDGKVQALVGYEIYIQEEGTLSPRTEDRALSNLIRSRGKKFGDACVIDAEGPLDDTYVWAGITIDASSIEDLFAKAAAIAREIPLPLFELAGEVSDRISAF